MHSRSRRAPPRHRRHSCVPGRAGTCTARSASHLHTALSCRVGTAHRTPRSSWCNVPRCTGRPIEACSPRTSLAGSISCQTLVGMSCSSPGQCWCTRPAPARPRTPTGGMRGSSPWSARRSSRPPPSHPLRGTIRCSPRPRATSSRRDTRPGSPANPTARPSGSRA